MQKSIVLSSGVAVVTFVFKSQTLEDMCDQYRVANSNGNAEEFLKEHENRSFTLYREISSIEYIQRLPSSTLVVTEKDLQAIEKLANEVRYQEVHTTTLAERLFA